MTAIFDVALPFFAVIACGFAALHWRLLQREGIVGLNTFVFYLALPALLVGKLGAVPLARLFDWRFLIVFYSASLFVYGLLLAASLARGSSLPEAALRSLAAVWGNWGYMGIPLLLSAFGAETAILAVLAVLGDNLLTAPLTIVLIEAGRSGRAGFAALGRAFRNVARNPLVIATVMGCMLAASGLALPSPVQRFLELLGASASPCALFALGASLVGVPVEAGGAETLAVSLARLVLHPALVWLGAVFVLPLAPQVVPAAVITAALPTAATVFVLAQRYETFVVRASTVVLVTHLLSVLTLSLLLVLFVR